MLINKVIPTRNWYALAEIGGERKYIPVLFWYSERFGEPEEDEVHGMCWYNGFITADTHPKFENFVYINQEDTREISKEALRAYVKELKVDEKDLRGFINTSTARRLTEVYVNKVVSDILRDNA